MNIKQIKEQVRLLKLSNPNMNAYEILKKRNFILGFIPTELQDELPEGCYFKKGYLRVVLIHPDLDEYVARLVYVHELAHSILHPEVNTLELESYDPVFVKKIELEADTFAAEFLLDDNVFEKYRGLSDEQIAQREHVYLKHVELKRKHLGKSNLSTIPTYENECIYKSESEYMYEWGHEYEYDSGLYI